MTKKIGEVRIRGTLKDWFFDAKGNIEGIMWGDTWNMVPNGTRYTIYGFKTVNSFWDAGKSFLVRTHTCNLVLPKDSQRKDINNGIRQDQF